MVNLNSLMVTGNISKSVNNFLLKWNTSTMNATGQEEKIILRNKITKLVKVSSVLLNDPYCFSCFTPLMHNLPKCLDTL